MPCYHPLKAFQAVNADPSGKRSISFRADSRDHMGDLRVPLSLPCGRCIGCRLQRSKQWAVRLMHEKSLHERSCFLTLTYDDDHLPSDHSLVLDHMQRFNKRLTKAVGPIRFFQCGEYGPKTFRPHYHTIIFGHDFSSDRLQTNLSERQELYVSPSLQKLWPYGNHSIGDVTFESAAYCARYILTKITGDLADSHYERVLSSSGEIVKVAPEFVTMSRRPGIGRGWFDKFSGEVFPNDRVIVRGMEMKPPRAYDKYLEVEDAAMYAAIKDFRRKALELISPDVRYYNEARLPAREEFAKLKQKTFAKRSGDF